MADFEQSIKLILSHEGGYSNHSADPGGETNLGITDSLDGKVDGLIDINGDKIGDVHVKDLTVDQAKQVYRIKFWDKMKGDDIRDQNIADILFDGFVNMGNKAIKLLQKEAGTDADGDIGAGSLQAINSANARLLFEGYKDARIKFYKDLATKKPKLQVFLKGWLNRINSFEYKGL